MASSSSLAPLSVQEDLYQILVGKYFFLAGACVLIWDYLCTLPEEIQVVWKRKKTLPLYLYLLIRYYALASMTIVAFAYFSTEMTRERCAQWMLFLPIGVTMPLSLLPGIVMLIRTYALYNRNRIMLVGLSTILVAQFIVGIWVYTIKGGTPAPDPLDNYEFHFCIYLPPKRIGKLSPIYVSFELGYETLIFLFTVARTVHMHRQYPLQLIGRNSRPSLLRCFIRDGVLYYAAIFALNLMWILMILHAPTGLRAIASQPAANITVVIISRITLSMRTEAAGSVNEFERTQNGIPLDDFRAGVSIRTMKDGSRVYDRW